jgi:hypothetical protein
MPAAVPLIVGGAVGTGAAAAIGTAIAGAAISTAVATGIGAAVVGTGVALATGQKPSDALKTGVISGLTAGVGSSIGSAMAGAGTISDAAFVAADAAQLAGQGLGEAAIAQNLVASGVNATAAQTAAALAASGATEAAISNTLGSVTLFTEPPTTPPPSLLGEADLLQDVTFPQQGLQVPPIDSAEVSLIPQGTALPGEGLLAPSLPAVGAMGGAQGLAVGVPGGTITQAGLTPTGAVPVLGDPASLINNPDVLGQPVITPEPSTISVQQALRGAQLVNQLMNPPEQQGMPMDQGGGMQAQGVDYSGLLALMQRQVGMPNIGGLLAPAQIRYPNSLLG